MSDNLPPFSIKYSLGLIVLFLLTPVLLALPLMIAHILGYPLINMVGLTAENFYLFATLSQSIALILILYLIRRRLHSRSLGWSHIGLRHFRVGKALKYIGGYYLFVICLLIGLAIIAVVVGTNADESIVKTTASSVFGGLWLTLLFSVLVAPVIEEILFRGVLLTTLEKRYGIARAVIFSGLVFSFAHIGNPIQAVGMVPMGLYLGLMYHKTGSIIPGMALHASWNLLIQLVK